MFPAFRSPSGHITFPIKFRVQVVGALRLVLFCLPFIASISQAVDPPFGEIVAATGSVTAKKPGAEEGSLAPPGFPAHIGDTFKTGKASNALLQLLDGTIISFAEETEIRINQYSFDPETMRRTVDLRIIQGASRIIAYKQMGQDSVIRSIAGDALITANEISDFVVTKTPGGTEVVSLKGAIRVKNSTPVIVGEVKVDMNQKTVVSGHLPPSSPTTVNRLERKECLKRFRSNGP